MSYIVVTVTVTFVTSHCFSFTKSKNKKRNRRIEIKNKKDLNKKRETKKTSPLSLILTPFVFKSSPVVVATTYHKDK